MSVNTRTPLPSEYQSYLKRALADGASYEQVPTVQFLNQYNKIMAYNPSLVLFPSAEKPGTLYTVTPNTSSADFTVTRASSGSYFDKSGVLKMAGPNEPRLDWNPATGQFNGVLVEPAGTNLIVRSTDFNASPWIMYFQGRVTSSSEISPDGISTFQRLEEFTNPNPLNPGIDIYEVAQQIPWPPTSSVVFSCFFKPDQVTQVRLAGGSFIGTPEITFDLLTKQRIGGSTPFEVQSLPNNVVKLSLKFTTTNTTTGNSPFIIRLVKNGSSVYPNPIEGNGLYIWGAQAEFGTVATSHIPTFGTTGSRSADNITNVNASSLIGQTEGSMYVEVNIQNSLNDSISKGIFSISSNSTSQNRIDIYRFNNQVWYDHIQGGVFQGGGSFFTVTNFNQILKITLTYTQNNIKTFINGTLRTIDTSGTIPTCDTIKIGNVFNSSFPYGNTIKMSALYTRALSDEEAINLTTL